MTLLHPSRAGSTLAVWCVDGQPVRLVSGSSRFRVIGEPHSTDVDGVRHWRVRARGDDSRVCTFELRETADGWVLAGVGERTARTGGS